MWDEIVYVAYYLHWPHAEILDLEHATRSRLIEAIGRIHSEPHGSDESWR